MIDLIKFFSGVFVGLGLFAGFIFFENQQSIGAIDASTITNPFIFQQGHRTAPKNTTGTLISKELEGTCNLSQSQAGTHAATSSKEYFCAVTGVTAGDRVIVSLPAGAGANLNGPQSLYGGFFVNGAYATTSGAIGVSLFNSTGAATSSIVQATTSVQYRVTN